MIKTAHLTKSVKLNEIKREWHLIDCRDKILGRIATRIAFLLQGKHKTSYVPYLDVGDYVVVINAREIKVTGKKEKNKLYRDYSGYPGGLKEESLGELRKRLPQRLVERAVRGMLPKNRLRKKRMSRLFVFPDDNHPFKDKFVTKSLKKVKDEK